MKVGKNDVQDREAISEEAEPSRSSHAYKRKQITTVSDRTHI